MGVLDYFSHQDLRKEETPQGIPYTPAAELKQPLTPYYKSDQLYDHNPAPKGGTIGNPAVALGLCSAAAAGLALARALPK
ncbi:hypothetical protein AAVH_05273 [Aphelenchoides avenae]|nr:hypothetical protein AAVH_05273 [Aphelenchus avenae]